MRTIALTGNLDAQNAAKLQLDLLISDRRLDRRVRVITGLTNRRDAYNVRDEGGEVWHCGMERLPSALTVQVDRVLPATTFATMSQPVITSLDQFLTKHRITREKAYE